MPHTTITTLSKDGVNKKEQIQATLQVKPIDLLEGILQKNLPGN